MAFNTTNANEEPPSGAPETSPSLCSFLSELHVTQVTKSLWLLTSHKSVRFHLTPSHCVVETVQDKEETLKLPWRDVLGAHVLTMDGNEVTNVDSGTETTTFQLGLFACVCQNATSNAFKARKTSEFYFIFEKKLLPQVLRLQEIVNFVADPRNHEQVKQVDTFDKLEIVHRSRRKFLVLVNPVSGPGRAMQIYEKKVAPLFRFANIETQVETMTHANHAMELAMQLSLNVYDCVVALGGDGSLYEIVQGLMKRSDWNLAIRQNIGIIPGGSGNGLANSIAFESQERGKPVNLAYILVKGVSRGLDIASVRNGKETVYSFLSLEWASIADADIESEKLRCLGGLRFTVTYLNQLLFQRPKYPGTIWYLEEEASTDPPKYFDEHESNSNARPIMDEFENGKGPPDDGTESATSGKWKKLGGHFRIVWIMNMSHAAADAHVAPNALFDDGFHYITFIDGTYSRKELFSMLLAMDSGSHMDMKCVQQIRTRAYKVIPERPNDMMCVDGEVMEGPYMEAQVHRGLARTLVLPK